MRLLPPAALTLALSLCSIGEALAQEPHLVFTSALPEPTSAAPEVTAIVEERGLALWSGASSEFGVGAVRSDGRWTFRTITSMTTRPVEGHARPMFQQFDVVRPVLSNRSLSVAAGGGLRQEWDGTRVYVGRVQAGATVASGRLQGSVVVERAVSSPTVHDAADVVTSVGWSRPIGRRFGLGVESIAQDLEGLWNPAEADGGAKLLVGPSIHARSTNGRWEAAFTGGPVVRTFSTLSPPVSPVLSPGRHFGLFASATWIP